MSDAVHLPTLSTSGAKLYRRCPRAYGYAYEARRVSARRDPNQAFGTLGHRGLEAWWIARGDGQTLGALEAALAAVSEERDAFDRVKAEALMIGYHAAWLHVEMEVLGVEVPFTCPLMNPATTALSKTWDFTGVLDAIVRIDGHVYVVEHKTTSEDITRGSVYWERLTLDAQVSNYIVGAKALGYQPEGCIYDVIKKPSLRPYRATPVEERRYRKSDGALDARQRLHDETPAEYHERLLDELDKPTESHFARATIVRLADEERDAMRDLWATAKQIRESQRSGLWPKSPEACFRFNRPCEYMKVCAGQASIDDPELYQPKEERI